MYLFGDSPIRLYMRAQTRVQGEREESFINGDLCDNKQVYIYKGELY